MPEFALGDVEAAGETTRRHADSGFIEYGKAKDMSVLLDSLEYALDIRWASLYALT